MKIILPLFAVCALSACMGGGSGSDATVSTSSATVDVPSVTESANFASLLNDVRLDNGASPVSYDARLATAAQIHSNDQLAMGVMTHTGSDGSTVGDRVTAQGYNYALVAENVAWGYQTEESVMTGWTNSSGHHANNINPDFEDFGIAKAGSGSNQYWTLVLGTEQ